MSPVVLLESDPEIRVCDVVGIGGREEKKGEGSWETQNTS